jgi:hypothetical protein
MFGHPLAVQVPRNAKATLEPPLASDIQEMREAAFPKVGVIVNVVPPEIVIAVWLQDELGPIVAAVELGVPVPAMVMPIFDGTEMPLDHVHDPAGI